MGEREEEKKKIFIKIIRRQNSFENVGIQEAFIFTNTLLTICRRGWLCGGYFPEEVEGNRKVIMHSVQN